MDARYAVITMKPIDQQTVVVITGAAKGLARHLAVALALQGAIIVAHYHTSEEDAETLRAELQVMNPRSCIVRANLRADIEVRRMFQDIISTYKRVDVLINAVGNFTYKPYQEVTLEDYDDVMDTNPRSTFLCSSLVIDQMKSQQGGTIINVGCAGADRMTVRELTTPYYIAKTAVLQLTKIMARTYAPFGIRVNAISPGILESSIAKVDNVPAGRYATFDDIFNAINFILSPSSSYVNGANIEVAGGWIP